MDDLRESLHNLTHKSTSQITESSDSEDWKDHGTHHSKEVYDMHDTMNHLIKNKDYHIHNIDIGQHPHMKFDCSTISTSLYHPSGHEVHLHLVGGSDDPKHIATTNKDNFGRVSKDLAKQ